MDIIMKASKFIKSNIVTLKIDVTLLIINVITIPNNAIGTPHAAAVAILFFMLSP